MSTEPAADTVGAAHADLGDVAGVEKINGPLVGGIRWFGISGATVSGIST